MTDSFIYSYRLLARFLSACLIDKPCTVKLSESQLNVLREFFKTSQFATHGGIITDLDGTAVHEFNGKTVIHQSVEVGLKMISDLGRPIVINTLRFPLSVIRTFAEDWYRMSNAPIPCILLNGSQLGHIKNDDNKGFIFEQLAASTLTKTDIEHVVSDVDHMIHNDIGNLLLFFYPENWTEGEIIWTPSKDRIVHVQEKYRSASSVISTDIPALKERLLSNTVCMIFLLVEAPQDKLMAYQHSKQNNFITAQGVNKLSGTKQMASLLQFDLADSIGAGDTPMDVFLNGVGLSVHVGHPDLPFRGIRQTIKLPGFLELGDLLHRFATMQVAYSKK